MTLTLIPIVILAYLLGSIPFGLLISKSQGLDIREHGSKNIGATNVWRVMGRKWGLITFFLDAAKGWVAVVLGFALAGRWGGFSDIGFAAVAAALGCIIGHSFPVWLKFKGGKGVATSLGVLFGMMPGVALTVLTLWGVVFWLSRYVSLASLATSVGLPLSTFLFMKWGWLHGSAYLWFACFTGLLVAVRHRANITRLLNGTENRFGPKKETQKDKTPAETGATAPTPASETKPSGE